MRVVPIAAALWAVHALAQSPAPATPAPAPAPATAPAPAPAPTAQSSSAAATPSSSDTQYPTYGGASAASAPAAAPAEEPTHWGILLDAGIPDGVGGAAIFRPMSWLRLGAGGTYNGVSFGFRGGVSVIPFYFPFSPSLNLEVGHLFAGDVTPILEQAFAGSGITVPTDNRLLHEVSYDYVNGHLGLEFGIPKSFIFFLRAGASYIQTTLKGFEQVVQEAAGGTGTPDTSLSAQDLNIKVVAPSVKLGIIVYF